MEKDKEKIQYLDNREYQSQFLLDPSINSKEDYSHLDKNLAITNLKHTPKLKIDEPSEARSILRGLHVLNNIKHYKEEEEDVLIGYEKKETKEGIINIPVYERRKVLRSKYPKTYHGLKSEFISFVNSAAARNGHRMNSAITNRLIKEESISDKTEVKSKWQQFKKQY